MNAPYDGDHPNIMTWLKACYEQGPGGLVVVPIACTLRLKSGKEYPMPWPDSDIARHLTLAGKDDSGRQVFQSV